MNTTEHINRWTDPEEEILSGFSPGESAPVLPILHHWSEMLLRDRGWRAVYFNSKGEDAILPSALKHTDQKGSPINSQGRLWSPKYQLNSLSKKHWHEPLDQLHPPGGRHQKQKELWTCSLQKGDHRHNKSDKMKQQRHITDEGGR